MAHDGFPLTTFAHAASDSAPGALLSSAQVSEAGMANALSCGDNLVVLREPLAGEARL